MSADDSRNWQWNRPIWVVPRHLYPQYIESNRTVDFFTSDSYVQKKSDEVKRLEAENAELRRQLAELKPVEVEGVG